MNEDSNWDYTYSFVDGTVKPYDVESTPSFEFPWLTAVITIAIVVFIVLFLLFKTGILFVYEEEYEVEE